MAEVLDKLYRLVWGVPSLALIAGVGLYLSIRTRFAQIRLFPAACVSFWRRLTGKEQTAQGVSPFQALCTALAATVGTGNLAGVAGAMAIGGPGAIFWMWVCALLGMVTKLAEAALAVRYRISKDGELLGGPMYTISRGMGNRWHFLAGIYAFFGIIAAFGVGNATQINTVIAGINDCITAFGGTVSRQGDVLMGLGLAVLILVLFLGGAKCIGATAEKIVPFAAAAYLLMGTAVLVMRIDAVPGAFSAILRGAFDPNAVTGGVIGSLITTLRIGVSRGVFTNEAGMGTAGIAHGSANVSHPVEQGLMGIMEVFLDTVVICTMTALVILCSGVPMPYGIDAGVRLTADAFAHVLGPWVKVFIAASLCLFAFATVLGWGLYGARCAQYLFGKNVWTRFAVLQAVTVVLGAVLNTAVIWQMAEIVNGLMAIPNLISLAVLAPELARLLNEYKTGRTAGGGTLCKFPSMQTAVNPLPCENSIPLRWKPRSRERRSIT